MSSFQPVENIDGYRFGRKHQILNAMQQNINVEKTRTRNELNLKKGSEKKKKKKKKKNPHKANAAVLIFLMEQ